MINFASHGCGLIAEIIKQTRFTCVTDVETTLMQYDSIHNQNIPQRALNQLSSVQSLKKRRADRPYLFVNWGKNETELGSSSGLRAR